MLKLRINPIVAKDLKNIRDYIAEDNEEYAAKTIKEIYGKFENLQMFPGMGSDLSKRVLEPQHRELVKGDSKFVVNSRVDVKVVRHCYQQ